MMHVKSLFLTLNTEQMLSTNITLFIEYFAFHLADSLTCWECTSGKCLTSDSSYGTDRKCNGIDPVCIKQTDGKKVIRACEFSNSYAPLRPLAGQSLYYKGKTTYFCTGDKCNSGHEITPILFVILMPFFFSIVML